MLCAKCAGLTCGSCRIESWAFLAPHPTARWAPAVVPPAARDHHHRVLQLALWAWRTGFARRVVVGPIGNIHSLMLSRRAQVYLEWLGYSHAPDRTNAVSTRSRRSRADRRSLTPGSTAFSAEPSGPPTGRPTEGGSVGARRAAPWMRSPCRVPRARAVQPWVETPLHAGASRLRPAGCPAI